ncbi:MAG: ArnT family glycosyltransferase [bacterium]
MKPPSLKLLQKPLVLLLAAAFIVRFTGIWYGLPDLFNSDEPFNVANALSFGAKRSLEPTYFVYPTLYSYLLLVVYTFYFAAGKLFGAFDGVLDFGLAYFLNPTGLFFIGRLVSVFLGVFTIWLVYRIGERYFSKQAGLLAAALLAASVTHVDMSHWILVEPAVACSATLALYFILRLYKRKGRVKECILAGIFVGLAISTKYNAGFVLIPLFVAVGMVFKSDPWKLFSRFAICGFCVLGGFLLASPYWLFSFSAFLYEFKYTVSHMSTGMVGHSSDIPLAWPVIEVLLKDWTVGVVFIAGLIYVFFQKRRKQLLLMTFALPTLLVVGLWSRTGVHYLIPVFPALALLAALFLLEINALVKNETVKISLLLILFMPPVIKIVYQDLRLMQKDSRAIAKEWIEHNIPAGSVIAYENYVYGPNLFDPRRFLNNEFESRLLPLEIKEQLLQERNRRTSYLLVNLRKDFKTRLAGETVEGDDSEGDPYIRQLFDLRLPKLRSLKKAKIEYLMISSDNYLRYFKGAVPRPGTALWFAYQNGKRFYEQVFQATGLTLLKEFSATRKKMGPTIRIYKIGV